MIERRIFLMR